MHCSKTASTWQHALQHMMTSCSSCISAAAAAAAAAVVAVAAVTAAGVWTLCPHRTNWRQDTGTFYRWVVPGCIKLMFVFSWTRHYLSACSFHSACGGSGGFVCLQKRPPFFSPEPPACTALLPACFFPQPTRAPLPPSPSNTTAFTTPVSELLCQHTQVPLLLPFHTLTHTVACPPSLSDLGPAPLLYTHNTPTPSSAPRPSYAGAAAAPAGQPGEPDL
jgi:hypothetical protein